MVMVEEVLVLGTPNYSIRKFILVQTVMKGGFGHIILIAYNPPWSNHLLGVIHIVIHIIINFVLQLVMVKVAWVLGTPTLLPQT